MVVNESLSGKIFNEAIKDGYDNCGIISINNIEKYNEYLDERIEKIPESSMAYGFSYTFKNIKEFYPWAKSIIILTSWLGKYKYPESLNGSYAKSFMLSADSIIECEEYQQKIKFEKWMDDENIQFDGRGEKDSVGIIPLRHSAVMAGLGIYRKNNFFYGEKGSYYKLEGYLIDKECEYLHDVNLIPCSPTCNICKNACKTGSLVDDYTMNPLTCTSFLTTFGGGNIPDNLSEDMLGEWICGCDACQDACPHNNHDWSIGEEFYGLEEVVSLLEPENIIEADDNELIEKIIPKTDFHIPPERVDILRKNAKRVIEFRNNQ